MPSSPRMIASSSSSSSDSSASRRLETATARAPCAAACAATAGGISSTPSSTLATNSTGLAVSGPRSRSAWGASTGAGTLRAGLPAAAPRRARAARPPRRRRRAVAAARGPHDAVVTALGLLEVGVDELGLDRLDVGQRIDAALRVDDVRVGVRAYDVDDRVGLADVGEEAVAQPLAGVRPRDETGDVVEVDGVVDDLDDAATVGDPVHALVGDRNDGHVGLDRREGVVRRLRARPGQGVEQRRLAGVGHPDDADLHRPVLPSRSPSRPPAAMSEGKCTPR